MIQIEDVYNEVRTTNNLLMALAIIQTQQLDTSMRPIMVKRINEVIQHMNTYRNAVDKRLGREPVVWRYP